MIVIKANTDFGFRLEAFLEGEPSPVGVYNVPFDKSGDITHGTIESKLPHHGIPRGLICRVAKEIQQTSEQEHREITDKVSLVTKRSYHLSHIFEELGYRKTTYSDFLVLSRTYRPSHPN
ncbi:hypothetical protein CMO89_03125 [Candidatus Woesearchaeota archaeon]|nr:hypothetical protein [Candidatus Woesearchaeota archaeon]|tara:strand:+ start:13570 stop:13929 length:360 start_codon:yes stop_codon:yes gene_type:complete